MKKVLFIAAVAMVSMASCKKEHTCECTVTDSSGFFDDTTSTTIIKDTKSKAEEACDALESSSGTLSTSCEIK